MPRIIPILMLLAVAWAGCGRKGPPELTLEQIPEAIKAAFASARTALRTSADGVAKLVADQKYPAASLQLQALAANSDLTDEQRKVVAGATITVNSALQEQVAAMEAPVDPGTAESARPVPTAAAKEEAAAAAAVLEHHIRTK